MNRKRFTFTQRVPYYYKDEHKRYIFEKFRHDIGIKLFDILWEQQLPIVVNI